MDLDTKFAEFESLTIPNRDLLSEFTFRKGWEFETTSTPEVSFMFLETSPTLNVDGRNLRFTNHALNQFCGIIGVPLALIYKAPNHLIQHVVKVMLEAGDQNLCLSIRDSDVIARVSTKRPPNFVEFFECINSLDGYDLQHAYVSDLMESYLLLPKNSIGRSPIHTDDYFQYGSSVSILGNVIVTEPLYLRNVCGNISIGGLQKFKYQAKIGKYSLENCWERSIEHSNLRIHEKHPQIDDSLASAMEKPLLDCEFVSFTQTISKILDVNTLASLLLISVEEYQGYVHAFKQREKQREKLQVVDNPDHTRWSLLNTVTAAAKAFVGQVRFGLETECGTLLTPVLPD